MEEKQTPTANESTSVASVDAEGKEIRFGSPAAENVTGDGGTEEDLRCTCFIDIAT